MTSGESSTVHVVANRRTPRALDALAAGGADVVELDSSSIERTRHSLSAALAEGATRVVVIGGDGIVHTAIQELAGSDVTLGIVPAGTGNDFARALGLPDDEVRAAAAALTAAAPVDLLRTSHGWVATIVAAGFPAKVNARANAMRFPKGSSKYTVATFAVLPRLQPDRLTLTVDGGEVRNVEATILAVANTAYFGGGMKICPDASPQDGLLDVCVVEPLSRFQLLRFLPSVFPGKHVRNRRVNIVRCRSLTVEGSVDAWGDGEPLGAAPLTIECVPDALHVAGVAAR